MENSQAVLNEGESVFTDILPYIIWTVALVGSAGSIFLSDVMGYPPCLLCWYQRIALYPLVVIVGVGIVTGDKGWKKYAVVFTVIGILIAAYHNLLYYGFIPETITPCSEGVPCNARQLELFGFITIPLMSLASFIFIGAMLLFTKTKHK